MKMVFQKKKVLGGQKQLFSLMQAAHTLPDWASAALPEDRGYG